MTVNPKSKWILTGSILAMMLMVAPAPAQNTPITTSKPNSRTVKYPASFNISKAELDKIVSAQTGKQLRLRNNKYLDKLEVTINTANGDMRVVRAQLSYFRNGHIAVQVNGNASTLAFISSDDRSFFYKGTLKNGSIVMTRCEEDEIVSE